jgi:hypothetical protein
MEVQLVELCCASGMSMIRTLLLESLLGKGGFGMVWQARQVATSIQQGILASPFQQKRVSTSNSSSSSRWPESSKLDKSFAVKVGFGYDDLAEEYQEDYDDEKEFITKQYNSLEKEHRICIKGAPHSGVLRAYGCGEILIPAATGRMSRMRSKICKQLMGCCLLCSWKWCMVVAYSPMLSAIVAY